MKKKIICTSVILIFGLFGCASKSVNGNPETVNIQSDTSIIIGTTTKEQIIAKYGQPTASSIYGEDEAISYSYSEATAKTNPMLYVPVVGLLTTAVDGNAIKTQSSSSISTLIFNSNGILKNKVFNKTGQSSDTYTQIK